MRAYSTALNISRYPETNPFDMNPPLHNLVPEPLDSGRHDTPELLAAARAVAERTNTNLFCGMYGTNPLSIINPDLFLEWFPWNDYAAPSPLPEVALPERLRVLEQLNPTGNSPLFLVAIDDRKMLLKIFPDRDALLDEVEEDEEDEEDSWGYTKRKPDPRILFQRECDAYAHLLHFGVCKKGVVPNCYGWTTLSAREIGKLVALACISDAVRALPSEERPPKAILIEYFEEAERLSHRTVTPKIAQAALRALYDIHAASVRHGDVHLRNILLLPGKRVVWIDFDSSCCVNGGRVLRQDLVTELRDAWSYMYHRLLPDKRIGYAHL